MNKPLSIRFTSKATKDIKKMHKRGYKISKLEKIIQRIANRETLEPKYKGHKLSGKYNGLGECHIEPDWLLIYEASETLKILSIERTGTHSDLF